MIPAQKIRFGVCYASPSLQGASRPAGPTAGAPMMTNQKQEEPVGRRPAEVDEDWFIRIQRAKTAREQGQKAREGRPPVNPLSRTPLSLNRD